MTTNEWDIFSDAYPRRTSVTATMTAAITATKTSVFAGARGRLVPSRSFSAQMGAACPSSGSVTRTTTVAMDPMRLLSEFLAAQQSFPYTVLPTYVQEY